jgi:hypothetical protein
MTAETSVPEMVHAKAKAMEEQTDLEKAQSMAMTSA